MNQLIYELINHTIKQSITWSTSQLLDQPVNYLINPISAGVVKSLYRKVKCNMLYILESSRALSKEYAQIFAKYQTTSEIIKKNKKRVSASLKYVA